MPNKDHDTTKCLEFIKNVQDSLKYYKSLGNLMKQVTLDETWNGVFPWKHKLLIIEGAHLGVHDLWSVMEI